MIKNNPVKGGFLLFAPSEDGVDERAFITMKKQDDKIFLVVNKSATDALSRTVSQQYAEHTRFLAAH